MILPEIQMEKKMAVRPPSRMRGISMLPSVWGTAMSKWGSRRRWVVSSWVSMTMEEKWSFLAFSEMASDWAESWRAVTARRQRERKIRARNIGAPELGFGVGRVAGEGGSGNWKMEELVHHRGHREH